MATIAVFVALGGVSYAAITLPKNSVRSAQLAKGAVRGSDIAKNAVTTGKVANGSLRAADFRSGDLPAGPKGDPGAQGSPGTQGAPGAKGDTGEPGSARAYAHVTRTAGGDFIVDTARSKNVVNVALPSTGNNDRPCLILPATIDASTAVAIGTVDASNTLDSHTAEVQHRVGAEGSQGCSGNSIALYLKRNGGVASTATIAFNVTVP
ncbi:MAG TPA: collagen-like protein [Thermoleophilaceae bacterium]|nr:collagen-like protein [Thermoleophilaceae bacterium]